MKPPLNQTAYLQTVTRNAYGDFSTNDETELACHFREINETVILGQNEQVQSDAMAWFSPDSEVDKGSIIKVYDEFYRVERVIKARTLNSSAIQFIKCYLIKYGAIS